MWTQTAVLLMVFLVARGVAPDPPTGTSAVALAKLRLAADGKAQVDVLVTSSPPPEGGRVDVQFTEAGATEIVSVVGLNGVSVRRIATATRPLACGASVQVTATVVAPEDVKGPTVHSTLKRHCQ